MKKREGFGGEISERGLAPRNYGAPIHFNLQVETRAIHHPFQIILPKLVEFSIPKSLVLRQTIFTSQTSLMLNHSLLQPCAASPVSR